VEYSESLVRQSTTAMIRPVLTATPLPCCIAPKCAVITLSDISLPAVPSGRKSLSIQTVSVADPAA
jgi:hypothetical protein